MIDWRELYTSNRAAIEGRIGPLARAATEGRRAAGPGPEMPADGTREDAVVELARSRAPGLAAVPLALSGAAAPARPRRRAGGGMERVSAGDRSALLHTPAELPAEALLVVMLHGCTQTAEGFAAATAMNAVADRHGFVVLYPEQDRQANPQGCWNWFEPAHQARGGEPASIAAVTRHVLATSPAPLDPGRVAVAGLSAGGAMAAVLAATHPDVFAAVAVHSGLPYGSASSAADAFGAMSTGAGGAAVAHPLPLLVIHGTEDRTVAPANGERLLEQWGAVNDIDGRGPSRLSHGQVPNGYAYRRAEWHDTVGRLRLAALTVDGLGHAWSGGMPGMQHSDPRGPSASEAIARFFASVA